MVRSELPERPSSTKGEALRQEAEVEDHSQSFAKGSRKGGSKADATVVQEHERKVKYKGIRNDSELILNFRFFRRFAQSSRSR
jgi:hypothetical protein